MQILKQLPEMRTPSKPVQSRTLCGGSGKAHQLQESPRVPPECSPVSHSPCRQSKRRFERDCKEADRAQQYFEKMDADINVTKADVEKVR